MCNQFLQCSIFLLNFLHDLYLINLHREMLAVMNKENAVTDALDVMMADSCLSEISRIDMTSGPLVEFPSNLNNNVYACTVEYGINHCPRLMHFLVDMVVRRGEPVLPSDVLRVATLFSIICYGANRVGCSDQAT